MGVTENGEGRELDPRRRFRPSDIRRAWERQGNVCCLCERSIPFDLMHGDHITPHSRGGQTEINNLQALCGSCNLRKGSRPQSVVEQFFDIDKLSAGNARPRRWQKEALEAIQPSLDKGASVLVEACPGAGKTHFGLVLAYQLIAKGAISRVLIIVPTRAIANGWADAASARNRTSPTIPLRTAGKDWRVTDPIDLNGKVVGAIATYQALSSMPDMFLAHASEPGHKTLVIFDEVHHAGSGTSWGQSSQDAFSDAAAQIVCLSGTPFRTDRDQIAFVRSHNGKSQADYVYGYGDAIEDGACRPVEFAEVTGTATFEDQHGETVTVHFGEKSLSDAGERRMLRAALEWVGEGGIAERMLNDANDFIVGLRKQGDVDAAALVVCVDCDHADEVAQLLRETIAPRGVNVACSQSNDANDLNPAIVIERFRRSTDPWIVAVNMVSEGVDIKRLRAVVYLTNRSTLLSFRQIVGRVVRTDLENSPDYGRVYVPGDPRLLNMARTISEEAPALPRAIEIVMDEVSTQTIDTLLAGRSESSGIEILETQGAAGAVFDTRGREATDPFVERCRRYIELRGHTGTNPQSLALAAAENPDLRKAIEKATESDRT